MVTFLILEKNIIKTNILNLLKKYFFWLKKKKKKKKAKSNKVNKFHG